MIAHRSRRVNWRQDLLGRFCATVQKLGAELGGDGYALWAAREDAPAGPLARFEHRDARPSLVERTRGAESRSARAMTMII